MDLNDTPVAFACIYRHVHTINLHCERTDKTRRTRKDKDAEERKKCDYPEVSEVVKTATRRK